MTQFSCCLHPISSFARKIGGEEARSLKLGEGGTKGAHFQKEEVCVTISRWPNKPCVGLAYMFYPLVEVSPNFMLALVFA